MFAACQSDQGFIIEHPLTLDILDGNPVPVRAMSKIVIHVNLERYDQPQGEGTCVRILLLALNQNGCNP